MSLVEAGAGTTLTYEVKANVGGKLAQIGSRLIDSTAKKMANQFFSKFSEKAAALSAGDIEAGSTIKLKVPEAQEIAVSGTTQSGSFSPKTLQKLYSLNNFKPISFKIWLPIILGLFALGLIWTIFG